VAAELYLPKMSDHMTQGTIVKWHVREGDTVQRGQVVLEIETDKAVGEIEAPADGILLGMRAGEGTVVPVGEIIAFVALAGEIIPHLPPLGNAVTTDEQAPGTGPHGAVPATSAGMKANPPTAVTTAAEPPGTGPIPATPVARRMAKELGVDLSLVKGSGPGGRIRDDDVQVYWKAQSAQTMSPAASLLGQAHPSATEDLEHPPANTVPNAGDRLALSSIQRLTGQRMVESFRSAPHFYLQVSVDMTRALGLRAAVRERLLTVVGEPLSITAILVGVVAAALRSFPRVNSSFDNGNLQLHPQVNIGVAMGAEGGLVVPVIKEADHKSLIEIATALHDSQAKLQDLRFGIDDLSGGSFTISNLGMYGVDSFSAIVNPPQAAILAVGRIVKTPVGMPDDTIELRPMVGLTLSVDHRALDGVQAAQFLGEVKRLLEEPFFLLQPQ
jgi:pyruvate dehydrogenase E2 component (dihydrolipoamide acetyltransferase)